MEQVPVDPVAKSQAGGGQVEKVSVALYPYHARIVRLFADESHRTFSNAVQFIIEDWARQKEAAVVAATVHDRA